MKAIVCNYYVTVAESMPKHIYHHGLRHTRTSSLSNYQFNSEKPKSIVRMAAMQKKRSVFAAIFLDFITRTLWYSVFTSNSWPPEACNYTSYLSLDELSFNIWSSFHIDFEIKRQRKLKTKLAILIRFMGTSLYRHQFRGWEKKISVLVSTSLNSCLFLKL